MLSSLLVFSGSCVPVPSTLAPDLRYLPVTGQLLGSASLAVLLIEEQVGPVVSRCPVVPVGQWPVHSGREAPTKRPVRALLVLCSFCAAMQVRGDGKGDSSNVIIVLVLSVECMCNTVVFRMVYFHSR